jgi:type IV pilus assembly protein PilB
VSVAERPKLGDLLVAAGAISLTQLGAALADQRSFGRPLGSILVQMGYLDEETLMRSLARQLKLPVAWLRGKWVQDAVRDLLPAELALKHHVLPLSVTIEDTGKVLHLAMHGPHDLEALDAVGFQVGHKVSPVLAAASELDDALQRHYAPRSGGPDITIGGEAQARQAPEVLTLGPPKAAPAAEEIELNDVVVAAPAAGAPGAKGAGHASTEAALAAFLQLIEIFLDNGIITAEELTKRLQPYFSD